jgi:hypothetical protein
MKVDQKASSPTPVRLDYILVKEISPVERAANARRLLAVKSATGAPMAEGAIKSALSPDVKKALLEKLNAAKPALDNLIKTVEAADEVESLGSTIPDDLGGALSDFMKMLDISIDEGEAYAVEPSATDVADPKDAGSKVDTEAPMSEEEKAAAATLKEIENKVASTDCATPEPKTSEKSASGVPVPSFVTQASLEEFFAKKLQETFKSAQPNPTPMRVETPALGATHHAGGTYNHDASDEEVFNVGDLNSPEFRNRFAPKK